jgi:hypothetical protein
MLPYVAIFILIMLAALAWEVRPFKTGPLLISFALLLVFFAGLRAPYIDKDYLNYENGLLYIEEVNSQVETSSIPFFEPGFYLLAVTAKWLFPVHFVAAIMLFYAAVSVSLKLTGIRLMSVNPFMVLLVYFSQYFLLHEMTQVRIGLATGMFLLGLYYLSNDRKNLFVLIVLLSALFHYSSLLYLVVLFIDAKSFNRRLLMSMLALALLLSVVKLPLLQVMGLLGGQTFSKLDNYIKLVESGQAEQINTLNVITLLNLGLAVSLVGFLPKEFLASNRFAILHVKLLVFSILVLSAMSALPTIAFRVSELFGVVAMFAIYYLRYVIPNRIIALLAMVFLAAAYFYITLFYGKLLEPYQSILDQL